MHSHLYAAVCSVWARGLVGTSYSVVAGIEDCGVFDPLGSYLRVPLWAYWKSRHFLSDLVSPLDFVNAGGSVVKATFTLCIQGSRGKCKEGLRGAVTLIRKKTLAWMTSFLPYQRPS